LNVSIGIIGYGGCCALGSDLPSIEANLRHGRVLLSPAPFDLPFPAVVGKVADPLPQLPARMAHFEFRAARLALLALEPLTGTLERLRRQHGAHRVGIVVGSSTGGIDATEAAIAHRHRTGTLPPGYSFEDQHELGALPRFLGELLGVTGPAYTVSTACSSGTRALMSGGRLLRDGVCDVVLVGGVDCLCRMTVHGFHSLGILSPDGARPFCRDRAGTHIGEGAGWLVLVRDTADAPLAVRGWGDTSDAHSMAAPHPEGQGLMLAMREALAMAGVEPGAIDYVNAHGTGTLQNDAAEAQAIHQVLGQALPVSSTKGMTGHALGSAGAVELVILALAMQRGFLPPNASSSQTGTEALPVNLVQTSRAATLRRGLTVSAGFGGSNAAVLLEAA
jgi:3-oxoacyl-[acyl-carrier-protein] synthase I